MKFPLLLSLAICLTGYSVKAQTPQYDTMYVEQAPLVRKKKTVIHTEQQVKFYLSGYGAMLTNYNYYLPCTGWEPRTDTYKSTVAPTLGYGAGVSLTYAPKKFLLTTGLEYTVTKEKFSYTDEDGVAYSSSNQYNYLDISLTGGYWMSRSNPAVSVIASGGFMYNLLLSESGSMYDVKNPGEVIPVSTGKFRSGQFGFTASCKVILMPQSRLKYTLEPYYLGSLASVTVADYPYRQYYNRVGLRLGVMFSL